LGAALPAGPEDGCALFEGPAPTTGTEASPTEEDVLGAIEEATGVKLEVGLGETIEGDTELVEDGCAL